MVSIGKSKEIALISYNAVKNLFREIGVKINVSKTMKINAEKGVSQQENFQINSRDVRSISYEDKINYLA